MAGVVVSVFLQKLYELLEKEAHLLAGVRDDVCLLNDRLQWLHSFLKEADGKCSRNERVKLWVTQIRDVAYEAEDIIDKFLIKVDQQQRRHHHSKAGFLQKPFQIPMQLIARHNIGKKIKSINTRLDCISVNRLEYGIREIQEQAGACSSKERERRPIVEEFDVVGIEDHANIVAKLLIEGQARRSVVSISGMGGLGKTTLARKVYNRYDIKRHFQCFAWIYVSQEFRVNNLLCDIIKCLTSVDKKEMRKMRNMNEVDLRDKILELFKRKSYLVVIDDIWNRNAWDGLADALPDDKNGSRILITTRIRNLALQVDPLCTTHVPRFLTKEECWKLLCKKAFPRRDDQGHRKEFFLEGNTVAAKIINGGAQLIRWAMTKSGFKDFWGVQSTHLPPVHSANDCPVHLVEIGEKMLEKCSGLPLAVVVLGGLLSRKSPTIHEWTKVLNTIGWQSAENEDEISSILALSYNDLPHHLKACFLHFATFPEDSVVAASKLIRMWVAEGFVEERSPQVMEDVAEDYLMELIDRSMIQVDRRNGNDRASCIGRIKECRIHDLLRDIAIRKAKESRFLDVYGNVDSTSPTTARRLAVTHHEIGMCISLNRSNRYLRSLYCFSQYKESLAKAEWKTIHGRFKFLRVMHITGLKVSKLPDEIGDLLHLKYILVKFEEQSERVSIPSTFGKLHNLQTLSLRGYGVNVHIHDDIWKMKQLRHLRLEEGHFSPNAHPLICKLTNLQTLSLVSIGDWMNGELGKLTNLRTLAISGELNSYQDAYESIGKLENLRSLWLDHKQGLISIPISLSHLAHLETLYLHGPMEVLPSIQDFPVNLTKLYLRHNGLQSDPMAILEKLPNLQILKILPQSCYVGNKMSCSVKGFPKLTFFMIDHFDNVEKWTVEKGAMPNLKQMWLQHCSNLKMIPEGFRHLTTLQELVMLGQPPSFYARTQENGEDWFKIRHIPFIIRQ